MKIKKIAACVMSLTLVFALGAANSYSDVFNGCTVSAEELYTSKLPENNFHPTQERYIAPRVTVPYSLTATLDNYDFELKNGETIDRETLKSHGIVITEECGYQHEEEGMRGVITPLATPRTQTHSIDICNVFIPSKLVNGTNKIYITYLPDRHSIDTTGIAELEINVEYIDGTEDSAVKDYLPNHIDRKPVDLFEYKLEEDGESCLDISPDKATVYTCDTVDPGRTLIYDSDDIDSLKLDYPQLGITEVQDSLAYGSDKQIECKDMTEGKIYYKLDAGDISDDEFNALCSELKNSKYGNDIKLAKFVTANDVDRLTISFTPCNYDYNPRVDYRELDEYITADGKVGFKHDIPNDPACIDDIYKYAVRLDVRDFNVDYTLSDTEKDPDYCYLQSLTSVIDSNDITDPYSQMVIPDPVDPDAYLKNIKPNMGGKDISMQDMTMVSEYIMADIAFTEEQCKYYDFNNDGDLSLPDLCMMKQYLMHDGVTLYPEYY
ncbi:MAG: dockerin type I domain-containing protein [Oscillospiraceae bacterium]|nr:dockerin type I domain-containing protein [Oscillospiraceae bacterium]